MKLVTLHSIVFLVGLSSASLARDYHVDSQKKFDAISQIEMQPGDTIRLKRGMQFTGMLAPKGKGAEGEPVRIGAFGRGQLPRINAKGKEIAGLMLKNPSYWEVYGLEITNTDGTDKDQGDLFGIYVLATEKEGTYRHIYIDLVTMTALRGYGVKAGSPCIDVGLPIIGNGGMDLLKTAAGPNGVDIGAFGFLKKN